MTDNGPYESERQASAAAAVRAVYAAFDADPGAGKMRPHNTAMLTAACEAAGVELGAYDERTLAWSGNWEPQACVVIAGIIRRAYEAGKAAGPDGTVTEWALAYTHHPNVSGVPARRIIQPYPDEASAREAVAEVLRLEPGGEPALMCREAGPWKEVHG